MTVQIFHYDEPIRLVSNGLAFCFKEARFSTPIGSDIEINKFYAQVSTIMRVISIEDADLLSQFDSINENKIPILERLQDLPPEIRDTSHQKLLINNHTDANKGKMKGYLFLEDFFGFCKTFKKVTNNLGFLTTFRTNGSQNILYSSMADYLNVTINTLYLYVTNLIPSVETQLLFKEATQNNYMISYDEFFTERRVISDMITQLDIGSSQQNNSPKYKIGAHQTFARSKTAYKSNKIALFDNLNL